ncbi:MAG: hypothetical protein IJY10_11215 [Lachnospiraceae bacterium]|nr:hypothetical protein [Lachnospiraceae bacterium]
MNTQETQFEKAKEKIVGTERIREGIGTLSEKSVHAVLKNYLAPNEDYHEVPLEGYVADIYTGKEIIEIQTRQFNRMRDKLKAFLPICPVTIVYPMTAKKILVWIDPDTGEEVERRKSPMKSSIYEIFEELYKIKSFLTEPNLRIKMVFLELEELKLLDGYGKDKKKRASKHDRVPLQLVSEMNMECQEDYMQFIPFDLLEEEFTTKEFAKQAKIHPKFSSVVVHVLHYVGILEKVGKQGNAFVYKVKEI